MDHGFEQDLDAAIEFRGTLTLETDRGCALMAAAYLDGRLAEWLTSYFVDDWKVVGALLGQDRLLSTFSSRIDTAYLLGLISPRERKALHLIRKIRNEFGHVPEPISFNDQRIASWCKSLEALSFYRRGNHRAMFTGAAMIVLAAINARHRSTVHLKAQQDVNIEKAISQEPIGLLQAIIDFANAPPEESEQATVKLQAACSALLEGPAEERQELVRKIVANIVKRLADTGDSNNESS